MITRLFLGLLVSALGLAPAAAGEESKRPGADRVVVSPEPTDELLANPGMGWQTFHQTRKQDRNLPDWIPSTVHYARWGWKELEPEAGKLNETFLDQTLRETRDSGQQLAFRVMCCSTSRGNPYHPSWLKQVGGRIFEDANYDQNGPFSIPDLDDPKVLDRHLDFIRRLAARYDGHPDIDHVDLGTVGWWGEWHLSGCKYKMPTPQNQKKIVDCYLDAFKKTPVIMLIGGDEALKHAIARGAGWRADCLGDMGGFSRNWCHMLQGYPQYIVQGGIEDAWQKAPVAWESCWDMRKWVGEGWPLRYIFNYALALHGSYLNNKSSPLPEGPQVRPETERFLRRLGYRFVLKQLEHAATAKAGQSVELKTQWQNTGSAPCYRPYRVAYRLTDAAGKTRVLAGRVRADRWMPGTVKPFAGDFLTNPPDLPLGKVVEETESLPLPAELAAGTYRLAIALVAPDGTTPVIRLGIRGRQADGWYDLSRIEITR